ncbi:Nicotinamidase family protein YcaC [Salmonella enterica subsp. houtenae serovar Houten]|nr:Nicotinamidase family protein YcaC [Salmonella enterica subsp. houtenae serovar Houten]
MSTRANFNGQRPAIDANDAVMLLIDHQSGLFQTVGDMPMPELRARCGAGKNRYLMQHAGHYYGIRTTGTKWSVDSGNPCECAPRALCRA